MNPPTWLRLAVPKVVRDVFRPVFYRLQSKIVYSREFYEQDYHRNNYRLHERSFDEVMTEWELLGWKEMLYRVVDRIAVPFAPQRWLEVACHHGKTAFCVTSMRDLPIVIQTHLADVPLRQKLLDRQAEFMPGLRSGAVADKLMTALENLGYGSIEIPRRMAS